MPREPGAQIDRYVIEALIGEGSSGDVYRARDQRLDRVVALKVLRPPPEGSTDEIVASALREARAAAAVHHPNVTEVFDVDQADGALFIVMEHVLGTSLRRFVGDGAVPLARRIRWLAQIAAALHAAHGHGVVHRDVKPENVMVSENGDVRVLDFGIARRPPLPSTTGDMPTPSSYNRIAGTPDYMAPEQARGEELDGRADQFAWGVLAYEILTGASPWRRKGAGYTILIAVLQDEPAPFAPDLAIPDPVALAVMRALSKSRDDRFASMAEAVDALLPFAERTRRSSVPSDDPPGPSPPRTAIAFSNDVVTVAAYGPVLVTHWFSVPDLPSLRRVGEVQGEWMRTGPPKLGAVTVLDPKAGHALSGEARDESVRLQRAARGRVVAVATIVHELGFRAAIVRSVLTGLALLSSHGAKDSVVSTPAAAAAWLSRALEEQGTPIDAAGLAQAIGETTAVHERGAPRRP